MAIGVAVLTLLVFSWQSWRAVNGLRDAEGLARPLADRIVAGDVDGARRTLKDFDDATTRAHHATDGPGWWLVSKIPLVGRNVGAVRTVAAQVDAVADEALPGVVDVADRVRAETFRPKNGRVNLAAVRRATPVLVKADEVIQRANAEIGDINVDRLLPLLQQPIGEVQAKAQQAASATGAAHIAADLMPGMLGADGSERRYLLLFMNNAEVRSLGGMPGSVAEITAKNGRIEMGQQGGIHDIPPAEKPLLSIKPELRGGFVSSVGTDIRDGAAVPDFPRAAALTASVVSEHWEEKYDGVVAVDPVTLGYLLGGLGPINVGDGVVLNEVNAVTTLLNGVYLKYITDFNRQDDVFELAARRSFDALTDGQGNSIRAVRALVRGAQERRVMVWSRHADEQRQIRDTGVSGMLREDRHDPEVGFFVNDGASTKMEFYLRMGSRLRTSQCESGGVQHLRLTTELSSLVPQSGALLPVSVTGLGSYVDQGNMLLNGIIMAPPGGRVTALSVDGRRAPVGSTVYHGRQLVRFARVLTPGQTSLVTADIVTAKGAHGKPVLRTTPGVVPNEDAVDATTCD